MVGIALINLLYTDHLPLTGLVGLIMDAKSYFHVEDSHCGNVITKKDVKRVEMIMDKLTERPRTWQKMCAHPFWCIFIEKQSIC